MRKALSKALLLLLCFTFVFTGLIACTGDLEEKLAGLEDKVNQNTTNDQADAAALAELKALVEQVKATADAAALKTSLDAVIADLEALEGVTATQAKLNEVKAELEAALEANSTADAATKAQLLNAIAAVDTIAKAAATKAELDAVKGIVDATKEDLVAAKVELKAAVEALEALNGSAATKAELDAAKADLAKAIADVEANLKALADATATKAELEATKAELDAAIAAVKATADDAATKAEFDEAMTEIEGAVEALLELNVALDGKITEVATNLGDMIANLETDLTTAINTLSAKVDAAIDALTADITALQGKDTELAGLVAVIKADVDALKEAVKNLQDNNFVDNFENATKVLNGDLRVVIVDGEIVALVAEGDAEWETAADYSLAMFDTLRDIDETLYAPVEIEKFGAVFEDLKFFLGRAVSVEAIVDYFNQLLDYDMPSLPETLAQLLEEKVKVTTDPADLDQIKAVKDMIVDFDTIADYAELKAWFDEIVAAHDNLLAAAADTDAAEAAIEKIGYVVFTTSEADIAAAATELEKFATYFDNEDWTKYYTDDVTTLISNYTVYTDAVARYAQLTKADAMKPVIIDEAVRFEAQRPLWTDKAALDKNLVRFNNWLEMFELDVTADADSIATMYPGNVLELLDKAIAYADAMDAIYGECNVAALNACVDLLVSRTPVLWTDKAESDEYVAAYAALKAAVEAVADYDAALDANYATMVGVERADAFAAIVARHAELDAANAELDALYAAMADKLGNVTFKDYDAIVALKADAVAVITAANVVEDDANYVEFAKENDPFALYDALYAEYSVLTAKVREIYDIVTKALAESNTLSLTFGNNIQDYLDHVTNIIALGVTDINLPLPGADGADEVNLNTLLNNLSKVITIYIKRAQSAVEESNAFTVTLATIAGREPKNLNNYADIKAVYDVLQAWVTKYLGTDDIADIQAVQNYLADAGVYYEFITVAEYTNAVNKYNTAKSKYDEAETAWEIVKAELEGLTTDDAKNNIHMIAAFATADNNYNKYLTKYYGGAINGNNDVFGEKAVYNAFSDNKSACEDKKDAAENASTEIKNAIAALDAAVNYTNYADVQVKVDAIKALIENYKTTYCPDLCNECIGDANQVVLAQKDVLAQLYAYAAVADKCPVLIDEQVTLYDGIMRKQYEFSQIEVLYTALDLAKSAIDAAVCVDAEADDDHACDECGATVTACADADADGDHACDECGAADITTCTDADGDLTCDECSTQLV